MKRRNHKSTAHFIKQNIHIQNDSSLIQINLAKKEQNEWMNHNFPNQKGNSFIQFEMAIE